MGKLITQTFRHQIPPGARILIESSVEGVLTPTPELVQLGLTPLAVTVAVAGALLSISRSAAYRLVDEGKLRAVSVGAKRRVPIAEIERYLADGLDEVQQ